MSIYKVYNRGNINKLDKIDKMLYFPDGSKIVHYNRFIDRKLFKLLNKITSIFELNKIDYFDTLSLDMRDYDKLMKYSIRCSREIIYNIIRKNYNFVSIDRLIYIGISSYMLSLKLLFGYDFTNYFTTRLILKDIFKIKYNFTNYYIIKDIYKIMESNILMKEGHNIAKKVRIRIGDIRNI